MNRLKEYDFFSPHRAFIVNFYHIRSFDSSSILLDDQEKTALPISKLRVKEFWEEFLMYLEKAVSHVWWIYHPFSNYSHWQQPLCIIVFFLIFLNVDTRLLSQTQKTVYFWLLYLYCLFGFILNIRGILLFVGVLCIYICFLLFVCIYNIINIKKMNIRYVFLLYRTAFNSFLNMWITFLFKNYLQLSCRYSLTDNNASLFLRPKHLIQNNQCHFYYYSLLLNKQ